MKKDYNLEDELYTYFQYKTFRMGQREIIEEVLQGNDVLGVLPTGSGKSICYQLPAQMLDGLTVIVSPLISLMEDQVKQLKAMNFKRVCALNSFIEPSERYRIYQNLSTYKLVYVSPELLQQNEIRMYLKKVKISLFVIDEAHCISQWGHEFRPDYQKLNSVITSLGNPTILALSATATKAVQDDIIQSLDRPFIRKHIYPMDRPNITLTVKEVEDNQEKLETIQHIFSSYRVPSLIYFSSRQAAEHSAMLLSEKLPNHRVAFYHGGMDQMDRTSIQQQFMNDQLDIVCCTSAFGMGINKPNIRLIIHYHFPAQSEAFIQEIGRAGRDGLSSVSLLLYSKNDEYIPRHMITNELPSKEQLSNTFELLKHIQPEQSREFFKKLPEQLNLTETQWRFIYHQLKKHNVLDDTGCLSTDKENDQQIYQNIEKYRESRVSIKEDNLQKMIYWIHEKGCLRANLYKSFQDSYAEPISQCCSNCGFSWDKWNPEQTPQSKQNNSSWQTKLRNLLLIGDPHEST